MQKMNSLGVSGAIWRPWLENGQVDLSGRLLGQFGGRGTKMFEMSSLGTSGAIWRPWLENCQNDISEGLRGQLGGRATKMLK